MIILFVVLLIVLVCWLSGKHAESMAFLVGYERGWSSKEYDPETAYIDYLNGEY